MLISALPPLVTRFGVGRLPVTVALVDLGLFGATTLGPLVGGLTAGAGAWRTLTWVVAGSACSAWASAALGYPALRTRPTPSCPSTPRRSPWPRWAPCSPSSPPRCS